MIVLIIKFAKLGTFLDYSKQYILFFWIVVAWPRHYIVILFISLTFPNPLLFLIYFQEGE